ncbi:hypothetical protein MYX77_01055 [Acidobacteriia bacterium AH_259_A11_L15]|nr:hypothetical protein [Acidobacteriia bacterium AH_259_A11_L15]
MSVQVRVRVVIRTLSVNYIAGELTRVFQAVAIALGLDLDYLESNWNVLLSGLRKWLEENTLQAVYLEVYNAQGFLVSRLDLQIQYGSVIADERNFYSDLESVRLAMRKVGTVPQDCRYCIVVSLATGASDVPGWSRTTLRSTEGMRSLAIGPLLGSPSISSKMNIWVRR